MTPPADDRHGPSAEVLAERIAQARHMIEDVENNFQNHLQIVVFEEFKKALDQRIRPLERIVYTLAGFLMLTVLGAIVGTTFVLNAGGAP